MSKQGDLIRTAAQFEHRDMADKLWLRGDA